MFRPNQTCDWHRSAGRNKYGEESYADPVKIGFSPVRLTRRLEKTSVRADSSASRGQSDQTTVEALILVEKRAGARMSMEDVLVINGNTYTIKSIEKRTNVWGLLDHWEIGLDPQP